MLKTVDLSIIAKKTPGFVGADLANMLNEAAILPAREGREEITMDDLEEASEKVSIGPERKSKVVVEKERKNISLSRSRTCCSNSFTAKYRPSS